MSQLRNPPISFPSKALLLTTALALLPTCTETIRPSAQTTPLVAVQPVQQEPFVLRPAERIPEPECRRKRNQLIEFSEGRCTVKEGDSILKMTLKPLVESGGEMELSVYGIDPGGVDLLYDLEIFTSDHASLPYRIDYGDDEVIAHLPLRIRAEEGAGNTAVLDITILRDQSD